MIILKKCALPGSAAKSAAPLLLVALKDNNDWVRRGAAEVLDKIGEKNRL